MRLIWMLLLLPLPLFAQTDNNRPQFYTFRLMTMDDFLTTKAENGGQAVYKTDTTGLKIDGEIEINLAHKYIEIIYAADKKHPMKASMEGEPKYDNGTGCTTYTGLWTDTQEKTEITTIAGGQVKIIKVTFGPHQGDHAEYWDRISKYYVTKKP